MSTAASRLKIYSWAVPLSRSTAYSIIHDVRRCSGNGDLSEQRKVVLRRAQFDPIPESTSNTIYEWTRRGGGVRVRLGRRDLRRKMLAQKICSRFGLIY